MAATTFITSVMDGDDYMSDEQIAQLLRQAEDRLRLQLAAKKAAPLSDLSSGLLTLPKLDSSSLPQPYAQVSESYISTLDTARLVDETDRHAANSGIRKVEDPVMLKQRALETKKATAGSSWYNLPATDLTPALKRDLQVLAMRSVLDPKRHYKKENTKPGQVPAFSQVGTLIEGPTEFFSARLKNRDRHRTLVEEVLATEQESGRFKRKYGEIQSKKASGKKGHYKNMIKKRYGNKFKR